MYLVPAGQVMTRHEGAVINMVCSTIPQVLIDIFQRFRKTEGLGLNIPKLGPETHSRNGWDKVRSTLASYNSSYRVLPCTRNVVI
jgi:hypothetical protein